MYRFSQLVEKDVYNGVTIKNGKALIISKMVERVLIENPNALTQNTVLLLREEERDENRLCITISFLGVEVKLK